MGDKETIKKIAYEIWKLRQKYGIPGTAESDWLDAEREYRKLKKEEKCLNFSYYP